MKTCTRCGATHEATPEFFGLDSRTADGLDPRCRPCLRKKTAAWKHANPMQLAHQRIIEAERSMEKRHAARAEKAATRGAWLDANAALVAEVEAWWDGVLAEPKTRKMPEFCIDRTLAREHAAAEGVSYQTALFATAPDVRAKFMTMKELRKGLRGQEVRRSDSNRVWSALPYAASDLRAHLERKFKPGMTWANYGSHWCIDHVVPFASFGVQAIGDEAWQLAFAIENLQPLTRHENAKKGLSIGNDDGLRVLR
jgi:hypothetical protein